MQMQAAVFRRYGGPEVVSVETRPRPELKPGHMLVKVLATTVSSGDWRLRSLTVPPGFGWILRLMVGWRAPRAASQILGTELVGEVVALGEGVNRFPLGTRVIAYPGGRLGAHAEYCLLSEKCAVVAAPAQMNDEAAAALSFGAMTAYDYLLHRAELKKDERVLIIGAAGAVGSAAVQIARAQGAHVSAVCSATKAEMISALGASEVIDYQSADPLQDEAAYDVILDAVGHAPWSALVRSLKPGGRAALVVSGFATMLSAGWKSWRSGRRCLVGPASEKQADLEAVLALYQRGQFQPLIDSRYPLANIQEAHARVDSGRKCGNVIVRVQRAESTMAQGE